MTAPSQPSQPAASSKPSEATGTDAHPHASALLETAEVLHAAEPPAAPEPRAEMGRLIRFGAVGIVNTVITLASFALLTALGLAGPPSSAIAFLVGALNSYFVNSRWTFSDLDSASAAGVRFFAIQCLGAALSAGGVAILEAIGASHFVAECAVVPCVTISLYGLARTFVFRSDPA